jgi:hypothetical protein
MSSIGKNSSLKSPVNMEFSVCIDYTRVYRFGFNRQEKDDEVSGTANSVIAKFCEYVNSISFLES